jgi:DNA-binding PadR family transcriptional regulator
LRHWIIYVLKDSPKTGAEVMDAMESMSQGWWRPAPGSVYPLLESMKNDGVVRRLEGKKYELTDQGREESEWPKQLRQVSPRSAEEALDQIYGALRIKGFTAEQVDKTIYLKPLRDARIGTVPLISPDQPLAAVEKLPDQTLRPFSRMKWRSARRISAATFLSMSKVACPATRPQALLRRPRTARWARRSARSPRSGAAERSF